ncbi:hypothetical protein BT93_G2241 [Corymbia citriodora subsp. variegata]|nr:hypothetical protein BT93_G2241 [Corymbia citriodora subsp. variegata]
MFFPNLDQTQLDRDHNRLLEANGEWWLVTASNGRSTVAMCSRYKESHDVRRQLQRLEFERKGMLDQVKPHSLERPQTSVLDHHHYHFFSLHRGHLSLSVSFVDVADSYAGLPFEGTGATKTRLRDSPILHLFELTLVGIGISTANSLGSSSTGGDRRCSARRGAS